MQVRQRQTFSSSKLSPFKPMQKDVVMRDLKNKGDAEAEETRSVPERVDEFFR